MMALPWNEAMVKTLEIEDIQAFLAGFAAAIELDQVRVESLPQRKFHPRYRDSMWRGWRSDHMAYIDQLLATVDAMSPELLEELTRIATLHEPAVVGEVALDLLAEVASGSCPREELDTATLFFGHLIRQLRGSFERKQAGRDARALMFQWLPVTDPLRIAQDPECGYGQPTGSVS
jgi:predicted ATPase